MLAAALLTVISFHNLFVGTMLCFLVSAAPAGLLAISLAVSAAGSMVIVNTVVLVKARFGLGDARPKKSADGDPRRGRALADPDRWLCPNRCVREFSGRHDIRRGVRPEAGDPGPL